MINILNSCYMMLQYLWHKNGVIVILFNFFFKNALSY